MNLGWDLTVVLGYVLRRNKQQRIMGKESDASLHGFIETVIKYDRVPCVLELRKLNMDFRD